MFLFFKDLLASNIIIEKSDREDHRGGSVLAAGNYLEQTGMLYLNSLVSLFCGTYSLVRALSKTVVFHGFARGSSAHFSPAML